MYMNLGLIKCIGRQYAIELSICSHKIFNLPIYLRLTVRPGKKGGYS